MAKSIVKPANVTVVHSEEVDVSPRETISPAGFSAVRTLLCKWPKRIQLATQLLGGVTPIGGDDRQIAYSLPQEYPHQAGVFCSGITEIMGFGYAPEIDTTLINYSEARLTVQYEAPTINIGGGLEPLVEESLEPSAEFLTVSNEELFWDSSGTQAVAVDDSPGVQIRFLEWVFSIKNLPFLPAATLNIGRVNVAALRSRTLGITFAAQTLLYSSVLPRRKVFYTGGLAPGGVISGLASIGGPLATGWDVTYRFTHNVGGWNKFRRGPSNAPQTMYRKEGSAFNPVLPYPTLDFTQITGLLYLA